MSSATQTQSSSPYSELLVSLSEQLKKDLTAPRFLIEQVLSEISARHEYPVNEIGLFFSQKYDTLEDYEVDLVFSPLFTPNWEDQLRYAKLLGQENLAKNDIENIISALENESLEACFQTQEGETWTIPLHSVNLDRFVNRLQLDKMLSDNLKQSIKAYVPVEEQHAVSLLARNPVWDGPQRELLLDDYLKAFDKNKSFTLDKVRYLTDFVRTYRPNNHEDLIRQLQSLVKSCESDLTHVADHSFSDQQLKELYSDSERAHFKNLDVQNHYNYLMTMAKVLLEEEVTTKAV